MPDRSILADFSKSKVSTLFVFKYVFYYFLFYICFSVKILNNFSPCFYGLFLTFCFLGENYFYLSLSYFISSLLFSVTTQSILFCLILVFGAWLIKLLYKKTNKVLKTSFCCLYSFILGIVYIYFNLFDLTNIYISIVNVFLNMLFMVCSLNFFKNLKNRNFSLCLNIDEIVCGCVVLSLLFCGFCNLNSFNFDIVKFVGILIILYSSMILKESVGIVLSVVMGLGACLCSGDLNYVTLFSIMSIFSCIFKNYSKIYASLMVLIVDLLFCLFFKNIFYLGMFLPTLFAILIYFLTPKKLILKAKSLFNLEKESNFLDNVLKQNKLQLSKRLQHTAEVFYEMDKNFRKLVKGSLDLENAKSMMCNEIIRVNCENCSQKNNCLKICNVELCAVFENLINVGFEKGKITLVDLPAYLTNRCSRLNYLVNSINSLLTEYKSYSKSLGDLDASKILIADQLSGISQILMNLSQETKKNIDMNHILEKNIKECLIYNNIIPKEVVCFEEDGKTNVVSMAIRSIDYNNAKICCVLNEICSKKMVLDDVFYGDDCDLVYLNYKTAPTYDIAVGVSRAVKGGENVCGDCYSAVRLLKDKFMLVLSDGMGHGEKANHVSELSLNMIENFYKAGFDTQTILTTVNKLLNLSREDVFDALDISVIDLKSGEINFIKQGATIGYIKRGYKVYKIQSNSLPLGILQDVTPKITKTILSTEDFVIMMSDGVVDAFKEVDLENFLKRLNQNNPQELADCILNQAKKIQRNYPKDDMSVLVGRLFYNTI